MQRGIFLSILFTLYFSSDLVHAQTIDETQQLLVKINRAVNAVNNGEFLLSETDTRMAIGEDTSVRFTRIQCAFKELPSDSLVGYKLSSFEKDGFVQVYNGDVLYRISPPDKTLEITDKRNAAGEIQSLKRNYFVYPFIKYVNESLCYLNEDTTLHRVKLLGKEKHNGKEYFKIETIISSGTETAKNQSYIFVDLMTFLPMGLYTSDETNAGKTKEITTFEGWVSNLKEGLVEDERFTKQALPEYNREIQFDSSLVYFKNPLLPIRTKAPDWELPTVAGNTIKLSGLKGRIVILDFWFKACMPCEKQMLSLQELQNKFDTSHVTFIGINTIDDPVKDKLPLLLKNRNITMPSVYNGKTIQSQYGALACPALFVLDDNGTIIFTVDGYSETLREDITRVINEHL